MSPPGVAREAQAWLRSSMQVQVPFAWLEACVEWLQQEGGATSLPQRQLNQQVLDQWLLTDLRELAHAVLPAGLSRAQKAELSGSFCVQLDCALDVSQPAYGQLQRWRGADCVNEAVSAVTQATQRPWEAKPTRVLLLHLTDGVQSLEAVEYQPIPVLGTGLRPGVKLLLQGQMTCRLGVLLLKPGNVKVLGGEVEELGERHSQGKVLCRALGLPEEEPRVLEEMPADPLPPPGNWEAGNQEPDDLELLANLEAQEGELGRRTEPSLESGYGTHSEASSVSYGNARPQSHSVGSSSRHGTLDSDMLDIPDEEFEEIPLDELDGVILRENPFQQPNMLGSQRHNPWPEREAPISPPNEVLNQSHFDSLDERDDILFDEGVDRVFPPEPEGPGQELGLDRTGARVQGTGRSSADSLTTATLVSQPFTYLCVLRDGPSPRGLPESVSEVRVKAFIVTLLGKLRSRAGEWQVSAAISDGTGYMDVDLSDQVLTALLGFSAAEKQTADPARKAAGMKACQQGLVDMCCVMTLRWDPAVGKALVIRADAVTEEDHLALEARVQARRV